MSISFKNVHVSNCGTGYSGPANAEVSFDGFFLDNVDTAIFIRDAAAAPVPLPAELGRELLLWLQQNQAASGSERKRHLVARLKDVVRSAADIERLATALSNLNYQDIVRYIEAATKAIVGG